MQRLIFLLLFLLSVSCGSSLAADNSASYYIPPTQFSSALQIMDRGFANIFALFRAATGSFSYDEGTKNLSSLRLAIDTTSLLAGNNEDQRDLSNLLGTFQFQEIRITAPDTVTFSEGKADIKAIVTFHGASKPVTFQAVINKIGKSPSGSGESAGLSLRGTFKRADFGLVDSLETPERFGDTISLMLEMQAIRQ